MARKNRRPRSAAQKRATAKLVAMNKARRSGSPRSKRRVLKARTHPVAGYSPNPSLRKRRTRRAAAARGAAPRRRRHYKRNPSGVLGNLVPMLTDALIGASGAVVVNTALNWIPLPAALNTGLAKQAVKGAAAVALGVFGAMVLPRATARKMAAGALTVTMHEILLETVGGMVPGAKLGFYPGGAPAPDMSRLMLSNPAHSGMGGMSEYIRRSEMQGIGEYL